MLQERMDLLGNKPKTLESLLISEMSKLRKYVNVETSSKKATVEFIGVSIRGGGKARFPVKLEDTRNFTFKDIMAAFAEQYKSAKKMEKVLGKGGNLTVDPQTGRPYVIYDDAMPDLEKKYGPDGLEGYRMVSENIIFNPKDTKVKDLYGKRVLATDCAWDFDNTAVKGELKSIILDMSQSQGRPFLVELKDGTQQNFLCIREVPAPTYQPYRLAESKVRDSLMLKVFRSKDTKNGYVEGLVHTFKCANGSWTVNGMSASHLLQNYTWLDGSPCGEFPEED